MALKIVCSGHLIRHPIGGHTWHHLQYIVGMRRLGHEVTFFEDWGWPRSCYDPAQQVMTSDPSYGIAYLREHLAARGLVDRWCFLGEDGRAYGMSRAELAQACREADLYVNLSGINWIPEVELCRRRVLVDTDPVFTQIAQHGVGGPFARYHVLFTYGENVHRAGCDMPTAGARWLPTRQPVVLDLWSPSVGDPTAAYTSVINWTSGEVEWDGRRYGQKDRQFAPFVTLPHDASESMELTAAGAPDAVRRRLIEGGWSLRDPLEVTATPWTYQRYLHGSRAEFSVARHGYVATRCGWFSDRSSAYLALGRPVVVEDTGFSDFLPCGKGLIAFRTRQEAIDAIETLPGDYEDHCRAARAIAEEFFDAETVLAELLERAC